MKELNTIDFKKVKALLEFHEGEKKFIRACRNLRPLKDVKNLCDNLCDGQFVKIVSDYPFAIYQNEAGNLYIITSDEDFYTFHQVVMNKSAGHFVLTQNKTRVTKGRFE